MARVTAGWVSASRSAATTIFPASATATNFSSSLRRSNMATRFAHHGRRIEYGMSMNSGGRHNLGPFQADGLRPVFDKGRP